MILRSTIQSPDGEDRELEVVAASFEQGVAEIETLTPEGWRRRWVITVGADS